ncbi:hypothetical protein CVV38_03305 [Candidatus Peregrinibacteria bacterium HGW-Peregrinibacteria-1]|jgi:F0F1-type ATP synthase delta subunit|nr:MAG: hypothetical protein CVV38_03305 [Candidatus Peregrinibacteria bacterium HGW-Peregrinibacteria-1]
MIEKVITSTLKELLSFLESNRDFFELAPALQQKTLENSNLPESIRDYMVQTNEQDLLANLKSIFRQGKNLNDIFDNEIILAISKFLSQEIGSILDQTPLSYFIEKREAKEKKINERITKKGIVYETIKKEFTTRTYQEIIHAINDFAKATGHKNFMVVQSPREISTSMKGEIRRQLQEKKPYNYPLFQVNKKIIGGIRISENGTLQDHSWLSRVLKFTSITN